MGWRLIPARTQQTILAPVWEGIAAHLTLLSHIRTYGSVHLHLAGDIHSPIRASGIEKEESCRTTRATSPVVVGSDRNFRNLSDYQGRGPRWVGRSGERVQNFAQSSTRGRWRALIVVRRPLRDKLATLAQRAEAMLTRVLQVRRLTNV